MLPEHEQPRKRWVNQHGEEKVDRQVIGETVFVRQQPAQPPDRPQILILTDQMLEQFPQPDKYFKLCAMFGYTIRDYQCDIEDELIELTYPYIVIFLGSLQLGLFDSIKNYEQMASLMRVIHKNPNSHVLVSGLVPRPLDFPQSRKRCENYNSSSRLIVQELRRKFNCNVGFKDPFLAVEVA